MKFARRTILHVVLIISTWGSLPAQWVQTNGPYGGWVWALDVIGNNVFASVAKGKIFRSTNMGYTWQPSSSGLPVNEEIPALAAIGNTLLAGTASNGVYRSTDYGESWQSANTGGPFDVVWTFAVSGSEVYAGSQQGLFLSQDSGKTWSRIDSGFMRPDVRALEVDGDLVLAGTSFGGGIYRSTDAGASWSAINTGLEDTDYISALAIAGEFIFAVTGGEIYRSSDKGDSWISVGNGVEDSLIGSVFAEGGAVFAGTVFKGLFVSTDNGITWRSANRGLVRRVRAMVSYGNEILAGTDGGGIYRSSNQGAIWTYSSEGMMHLSVYALKEEGNILFAGTDENGVYFSTNGGVKWIPFNEGFELMEVRSLAIESPRMVVGTRNSGVYLFDVDSVKWKYVDSGVTGKRAVAVALKGEHVFVATEDSGLFVSTDYGTSWIRSSVSDGLKGVNCFTFYADYVLAGAQGVYVSTDMGINWNQFGNWVPALATDMTFSGSSLIVATTSSGGAYRTTDSGITWENISNGLFNIDMRAIVGRNGILYLGTAEGISVSRNNGDNWTQVNEGLPRYMSVRALAVSGDYMFFGADSRRGVWKRPISELITSAYDECAHAVEFRLYPNFPNPFNPSTNISYSLPFSGRVTLEVFDILGRRVEQLVNGEVSAGYHEAVWNASVPSGTYYYRLTAIATNDPATRFTETKKMMLVR